MPLRKWLSLALLLLPIGEIAVFVLVSALIGVFPAFALLLATSLAGAIVLRRAGSGRLARLKAAAAKGDIPELRANSGGLLTVVGGVLLLLPGFLTDILGLALLLPPVQRWIGRLLRQTVERRVRPSGSGRPAVVDLESGEWEQVPERQLPPKPPSRNPP
jgi:UPF0716 protein FxsA